MIADAIKERLQRDPFEPFRIVASSGKAYRADNPFQVSLMKSRVFIAAPNSDKAAELAYLHIASVEGSVNGHSKNRPKRA